MQLSILLLVAVAGGALVFTRVADRQAVGVSFFGLTLTLMFFIFQAPDVALSEIVIGAVALPLMVLLAIAKVRVAEMEQRENREKETARKKENEDAHGGQGAQHEQASIQEQRQQAEGA